MNEAFQKYEFQQSSPKKILIPRVTQEDQQSQVAFQLRLDFMEHKLTEDLKEEEV